MAETGSIDYGEIREDYAFFLAHSTETAAQIAALRSHVAWLGSRPPPAKLLEFGCGTGAFTERLLTTAGVVPDRLAIWLVEPVADQLDEAASRLAPRARQVIAAHSNESWQAAPRFDLILANHSLYYVPDPEQAVGDLLGALAPHGRLIAPLLDRANALARLWCHGYAKAGAVFPFTLAEDLEAILRRHGAEPTRERIEYPIAFPNGTSERERVLRFLFGAQLAGLERDDALALFDPHRRGSRILIETAYPHVVVNGAARAPD